ncbi:MAG: hypothetical protein ABI843_03940 [Dokdonella sp.]
MSARSGFGHGDGRRWACAIALNLLFGAALADADETVAPVAARFVIESVGGHVERITIRTPGGATYVLDHFVGSAVALAEETQRFAAPVQQQAFCATFGHDEQACKQSCGWAENARAFTRVTLQSAGKPVLLWNNPKAALRLNAGAASHTGLRGECLSPDGRFLSVFGDVGAATPAIVALRPKLPNVPFIGEGSGKTYGADRYFDFIGWRSGAQHTLQFSYGGSDTPIEDDAFPRADTRLP